jgi:membrane protease YdiL (CAAX protease family)
LATPDGKSFVHDFFIGLSIITIAIAQLVLSGIRADPGYFSYTVQLVSTIITYVLTGIFEEILFWDVVLNAFQNAFEKRVPRPSGYCSLYRH